MSNSWRPGTDAVVDSQALGYPRESLARRAARHLHRAGVAPPLRDVHAADGHTVKLPMDRGEGQQWNRAPGNLYSAPRAHHDRARRQGGPIDDRARQGDSADSRSARHQIHQARSHSERAADEILGPARCISARTSCCRKASMRTPTRAIRSSIFHGHFPPTFDGFREEPPDPILKPEYSERFHLECYNRIQQQDAHQFYKDWTGPDFPRVPDHRDPARQSVLRRLVRGELGEPRALRRRHHLRADSRDREAVSRRSAKGWARFMYGGSTGGWEALAAQIFYPEEYNGAWAACPDPIDFRAYTVVDIYEDKNAYYLRPVEADAAAGHAQLARPRQHDARRDEPAASWCSAPRAARASSGTSGRRCTRRWARTAIRSGSGTSRPA